MNNDDLLTLYKIVPKKIKFVPSRSDGPTASSCNCLFTSIANTLCSHFKRCPLPKINMMLSSKKCPSVLYRKNCLKWSQLKHYSWWNACSVIKGCSKWNMKSYCLTKNSSISTCMIPSEWKSAKVSPIYKSGDKSDPNNFSWFLK